MKSPVLLSFGITFAIWLVVFLYVGETTRNPEERAFAWAFMILIFPFAWFFVWIIVNGVSWWQMVTGKRQEDGESSHDAESENAPPKKPDGMRGS